MIMKKNCLSVPGWVGIKWLVYERAKTTVFKFIKEMKKQSAIIIIIIIIIKAFRVTEYMFQSKVKWKHCMWSNNDKN